MKIVMFYPSLSETAAHCTSSFISGVIKALQSRGHEVQVVIPESPESNVCNELEPHIFWYRKSADLKLNWILAKANVVLVQEKNEAALISRIGKHRSNTNSNYTLFFHDTSFKALKNTELLGKEFSLEHYDGVLAGCDALTTMYLEKGLARQAFTWQMTVDTKLFYPQQHTEPDGDLVWIGNWGDEVKGSYLEEFLIQPVAELGLKARVYGASYPKEALERLEEAGISFGGYLPYHRFPEVFARHKVTVHIPDKQAGSPEHAKPSIRLFEALSCGIPLIASGWHNTQNMFTPGKELLIAESGEEMKMHLLAILNDSRKARDLVSNGLRTINRHHSCSHRASQLEDFVSQVQRQTGDSSNPDYQTAAS